jgi:hypothetical protein
MRINNKSAVPPSFFGLNNPEMPFSGFNQTLAGQLPAMNKYTAGRLQILPNYVEPIFRIEKMPGNALKKNGHVQPQQ